MKFIKPTQNYSPNYLKNLLRSRGIEDYNNFITPSKTCLLNPLDLDNMDAGAQLLIKHLGEKVLLIVDCDNDGFTSSAIIYNYIKNISPETEIIYLLHEGKAHGLEDQINNVLNYDDVNLVIIPDASSNDSEYHKILKENGKDILVLDHHECDEDNNPYAIIINNQMSKNYLNKDLSGAGVVYKFCQYLDILLNKNYADNYLDLAAVGIIGDMMKVTHLENRYIFNYGLTHITNIGLLKLIEKQSFSIGNKTDLTPTDIAFYITPLINAVIRVGSMPEKILLFRSFVEGDEIVPCTKRGAKPGSIETIAEQNSRNCVNSRARQNRIKDKAMDLIDMEICKNSLDENKIIFVEVEDDAIDSVLTGLVAMQIMKKYQKPTLIGRVDSLGNLRGSARGDNKCALPDLKQFLTNSNYFDYAEGHANAFGWQIPQNKVESFIQYANEELKDVDFSEGVYYPDFFFELEDNSLVPAIYDIGTFPELWGQGNEEPLFVVDYFTVNKDEYSICGNHADTVRIVKNGMAFIMFKAGKLIEEIANRDSFTIQILGRANINTWGGNTSPQLYIEDYNIRNPIFDF